jgi:hypothetical protein
VQEPEADGNVVRVAAVVDGDGAVQVDEAPLLAVVEDEDVDVGPGVDVAIFKIFRRNIWIKYWRLYS